jgi:arylsulfatase A-like enzyme
VSGALVHVTDLLPTVAELAGIDRADLDAAAPEPLDGVSFAQVLADPTQPAARPYLYSDHFEPNGAGPYTIDRRTVRDTRWKIRSTELGIAFYDLDSSAIDEGEALDLEALEPDQQAAYDRLEAELERMTEELQFVARGP